MGSLSSFDTACCGLKRVSVYFCASASPRVMQEIYRNKHCYLVEMLKSLVHQLSRSASRSQATQRHRTVVINSCTATGVVHEPGHVVVSVGPSTLSYFMLPARSIAFWK